MFLPYIGIVMSLLTLLHAIVDLLQISLLPEGYFHVHHTDLPLLCPWRCSSLLRSSLSAWLRTTERLQLPPRPSLLPMGSHFERTTHCGVVLPTHLFLISRLFNKGTLRY